MGTDTTEPTKTFDEEGFKRGMEKQYPSEKQLAPSGLGGWVCPVCGRGLALWLSICPCRPVYRRITISPTYYVME